MARAVQLTPFPDVVPEVADADADTDSGSPPTATRRLQIVFSVVQEMLPDGHRWFGLCSEQLAAAAAAAPGHPDKTQLRVRLVTSTFRIPREPSMAFTAELPPLILVGVGTGIAPLRAMLFQLQMSQVQ